MRVNGEPERWLLAARLSRLSRKDRERGDELINGIQTQDLRSAEWAQYEGHVIVHVTKDRNVSDRYVVLKGLLNTGDADAYEAAIIKW